MDRLGELTGSLPRQWWMEPLRAIMHPRGMARSHQPFAALVAVVALIACSDGGDGVDRGITVPDVTATTGAAEPGAPDSSPSTATSSTPPLSAQPLLPRSGPVPSGDPIDPGLSLVQTAVADLSDRLDVPPEEITVVEALAVTWPDGSLGCPQPGMAYVQVPVDGSLVVLEAGGRRYEYHGGDPLVLCEREK